MAKFDGWPKSWPKIECAKQECLLSAYKKETSVHIFTWSSSFACLAANDPISLNVQAGGELGARGCFACAQTTLWLESTKGGACNLSSHLVGLAANRIVRPPSLSHSKPKIGHRSEHMRADLSPLTSWRLTLYMQAHLWAGNGG